MARSSRRRKRRRRRKEEEKKKEGREDSFAMKLAARRISSNLQWLSSTGGRESPDCHAPAFF
jgi:hypothetical protein